MQRSSEKPASINCALALGVDVDELIEDEWRSWKVFHAERRSPPSPREFWRRPYPLDDAPDGG